MQKIKVSLTEDEVYQAATVGVRRRTQCIFYGGTKPHFKAEMGEWHHNIEPCCAELAVAKYLNKYWTGGGMMFSSAKEDVGDKEVRYSAHDNGHLLIYAPPADNPDSKFIFVTGETPVFFIRGWIVGREAEKRGFWKESKRPCWWVPQSNLRKIT